MDNLEEERRKEFLKDIQIFYDILNEVPKDDFINHIKNNYEFEIMELKKYYRDHFYHLPNDNFYKQHICAIMGLYQIRFEKIPIT